MTGGIGVAAALECVGAQQAIDAAAAVATGQWLDGT